MLVRGVGVDVVDVGIFSDGDGERVGFDVCKERQATQSLISVHVVNSYAYVCGCVTRTNKTGSRERM
jgi:hypothetical protein